MHKKSIIALILLVACLLAGSPTQAQNNLQKLSLRADSLFTRDFDESIRLCDSILALVGHDKKWQGVFSRIKGRAYYFKGNYETASKNYADAVAILETAGEQKELGIALIDQAKLFRKLKMFPQAIETYDKARFIFEQLKEDNHLATVLNEWGVVYEMMSEYDKAISYYQKSLTIKERLNDSIGVAYANSFLSTAYMLKKDYKTARDYGEKSAEIAARLNDTFVMALQSSDLGLVYEKLNDIPNAISRIQYSERIAREMGYPDLLSENYRRLAQVYAGVSDYKNAYEYHQKHASLKDSLFSIASQKNIAELHIQYQSLEKDGRILQQENRHTRQQLYIVLIGALLFLTTLVAFFVYRTRKLKEEKLKKEAAMQAELLKLEAQNALQNDRLRISRDLHDNIGANLTFIQTAVEKIATGEPQETEQLKDVKGMLSDTMTELRRTVWLINKPSVRLDEWIVKLREYYRKIEKITVRAEQIQNEEQLLSSRQATGLFRIIQEAVNNSMKHAGAAQISINITADTTEMKITIEDNGRGFEQSSIQRGFGLENMAQNATETGGTIEISSVANTGTQILVQMQFTQNT